MTRKFKDKLADLTTLAVTKFSVYKYRLKITIKSYKSIKSIIIFLILLF